MLRAQRKKKINQGLGQIVVQLDTFWLRPTVVDCHFSFSCYGSMYMDSNFFMKVGKNAATVNQLRF